MGCTGSSSRPAGARRIPWEPCVLFLLFLVLYLLTPSRQYDLDVIGDLAQINELSSTVASPAHPLNNWIGVPLYRVWLELGNHGDSLRVMQLLNALTGAGAIALLYVATLQLGVRSTIAGMVSACVGLSYAFWTHTVDAFFIALAAFLAVATLVAARALARAPGAHRYAAIGYTAALFSLSTLAYQNNALLFPSIMAFGWQGRERWRRWLVDWVLIALLGAAILSGAWLAQALSARGISSVWQLPSWLLGAHGGMGQGLWRREGIPSVSTTITAWLATVFPVYRGMRLRALVGGDLGLTHLPGQITLSLFFLTLVLLSVSVFRRGMTAVIRRAHPHLIPALLWFAVPGLAVVWFDRAEVKLWLIPLFGLWMILALLWEHIWSPRWRLGCLRINVKDAILVALACGLGVTNWILAVGPNHTNESAGMEYARAAISVMTPGDLLLSSGFDWTSYVDYLSPGHQVVNAIAISQGLPIQRREETREHVFRHIEDTLKDGGRVYALSYFADPQDPIWPQWIEPYTGLRPSDFAGFVFREAWVAGETTVLELVRK